VFSLIVPMPFDEQAPELYAVHAALLAIASAFVEKTLPDVEVPVQLRVPQVVLAMHWPASVVTSYLPTSAHNG